MTALTWAVAARITAAIQKREGDRLRESVDSLVVDVRDLSAQVAAVKNDRAACELRSVKQNATKEDFVHTLVAVSANHREAMGKMDALATSFRDSVGKVHSRVDKLTEQTARLQERSEKRE